MSFSPNWASSPGGTIIELLKKFELNENQLAQKLSKPISFIESLLRGDERIDEEIANHLQDLFNLPISFWLNRETNYRNRKDALETEWIKKLPIAKMRNKGLLFSKNNNSLLQECLDFFGVNNISEWNKNYGHTLKSLAYRMTNSFPADIYSTSVWLREAELFVENIKVGDWDPQLFQEKLTEIKKLTRIKDPKVFLPRLVTICSQCGVKLAIVKSISGNRASGATKFVKNNPLIILSFRYLKDDHFWFTFFHEAGHLILHGDSKIRVESDALDIHEMEEKEANCFAQAVLLPAEVENKLPFLRRNPKEIIKIASIAGVSPGIIVGQMQFMKIIKPNYLNSYKRTYDWDNINEGIRLIEDNFTH